MHSSQTRRLPLPGLFLLLFVGLVLAAPAKADKEIIVIAHESVVMDTLKMKDLRRIYLSKKTRWPDDSRITATMLQDGPVQEQFIENILDRTLSKFATYWKRVVFTGKGIPPKTFENEADLLQFVAETPGAIGYVSSNTLPTGVRKLPLGD